MSFINVISKCWQVGHIHKRPVLRFHWKVQRDPLETGVLGRAIPHADHVNHRQPFQCLQPRTALHFPQLKLFTLKLGFMSYCISILNFSTCWFNFKQTTITITRVLIFSVCVIFSEKIDIFCIVFWWQISKQEKETQGARRLLASFSNIPGSGDKSV